MTDVDQYPHIRDWQFPILAKHGARLTNTGGNDPHELLNEHQDPANNTAFTNLFRFTMGASVAAQVGLLRVIDVPETPTPGSLLVAAAAEVSEMFGTEEMGVDIGTNLNCAEADGLARLMIAVGDTQRAVRFLVGHCREDEGSVDDPLDGEVVDLHRWAELDDDTRHSHAEAYVKNL